MIYTSKKYIHHYKNLLPNLDIAIDFIKKTDLKTLPLGKTIITQDVFVNVMEYTATNQLDDFYEGHELYLDIHSTVSGEEKMSGVMIENATLKGSFNKQDDIGMYNGNSEYECTIKQDMFLIVFPEDLHEPKIKINDDNIRKIIFKVKIS